MKEIRFAVTEKGRNEMAEYIDAELLMQKLSRMIDYCDKNKDKKFNALNVLFQVGDAIMDCPTADVVDVVRCKDCAHYIEMQGFEYKGKKPKHCIWHGALRSENYYCGDGIRRSESNGSKQ